MTPPRNLPIAVVAVVERGGRFLFVRRAAGRPAAGYWTPVTGRLEPGESEADAVAREAREEVGVAVRPLRHVWTCPAEGVDFELRWWTAALVAGEPTVACDEIDVVRWLTRDEIEVVSPMFETTRRYFRGG